MIVKKDGDMISIWGHRSAKYAETHKALKELAE